MGKPSMFFPSGIGTFHVHKKTFFCFKDFASEMPSQMMVHVRTDLDVIPLPPSGSLGGVVEPTSGYLKQVPGHVDLPNFAKRPGLKRRTPISWWF